MNSELKEGQERRGRDEFDNEYIEKRIGRIIERRYIEQKVEGKDHIIETKQIGKAPDSIEVNVNETNKGFMVVINIKGEGFEKGGNWFVSKDFLKNVKAQNKFENELRRYFKDVLVEAEIYPIVMNLKDKIAGLENKEKGEAYPSGAVEKKPSEYIVIGVDENGKPIKKEWSEFEKEILEEHKGYNVVKREV
jgi:hypothetical protein